MVILDIILAYEYGQARMLYFGGSSDSSSASNSAGSSINLKVCWVWLAENGISVEYWVDILGVSRVVASCYFSCSCPCAEFVSVPFVGALTW